MRTIPTLLLAAACTVGTPLPLDGSGTADDTGSTVSSCTWSTVDGPPLIRVPVGSVRYLPTIDPGCTETWTVVDAPGDNEVVHGFGGESRFVPDAAGTWTFALGEDQLDVEVVDQAPYHALFHPPSRSLLEVGGEVWAAQAYAPAIARLTLPDLQPAGEIAVGSWPVALAASPDRSLVYVAQAGDDHLGVIDVAAGRMVDAIHVGDEPSGVVVSPDGTRAYVTLATATEIAVVDLEHRARTATLPAPPDARALALSSDGTHLAVAGHRTGAAERYPFGVDEGLDPDVMVVDTASGRVLATFPEVASAITDLELDEARGRLLVTGTRSFPERGLVDVDAPPFEGVVTAWDLDTGALLDEIVLGPGGPATGMVLGPQALALDGDRLWVVAEGSSAAIALDAEDLHELARIPVDGQPRDVIVADGHVLSHGSQAFVVQALDTTGVLATGAAGTDPRPPDVAAGQVGFVSPGEQYGANYSCNSCHTDGRGDTRVWPAGPFAVWEASRAMFWLEGTAPLGWGGYVADVRAFGYTGYTSIIAKWPTTGMAEDLAAFLASLAPPAAANGQTRRSGALSEAGERGRALYEGEAACASCHPAPRTTTNVTLADGITPDESSIPSLVGIYRHNRWLKRADATTLRDSVAEAAAWSGVSLDDGQLDDLTRYLEELTDRDLFLLASEPLTDGPVGVDTPLVLTFNQPIWDDPTNLQAIALEVDGQTRSATPIVDGRKVMLAPDAPLPWDADVVVTAAAGLEAFDGRALPVEERVAFHTALAPALQLDGDYELVVDLPVIDFVNGGFDDRITIPVITPLTAASTDGGADVVLDLGRGLTWSTLAVVDDDTLHVPPAPLSFGFSMAQGGELDGTLTDLDGDGVADRAEGEMIMSGPGFHVEGISWTLRRAASGCVEGTEGDVAVDVAIDGAGDVLIDWGSGGALGLYVTSPDARLPVGPGPVTGGTTYWVLSSTAFPLGFAGPVTYGEVPRRAEDASAASGPPTGGAELVSGTCYRFSVTTDRFQTGSRTLIWP